MKTWWRRQAEPREDSVCLTRRAADGQIWALCPQTEPFLRGRFEEDHRVPARTEEQGNNPIRAQIRTWD